MQIKLKRITSVVLALMLLFSVLSVGMSVTAATQENQRSKTTGLGSVTATSALNADGSIKITGKASPFGIVEKLVILRGNVQGTEAADYLGTGAAVILTVTPSEATFDLNYDVTLKASKVTTQGYTLIVGTGGSWGAACYVASPPGAVEGVGGTEDPIEIDDGTSFGPGKIAGTATITAAGKVKVKLSVTLPSYIKQVRWISGKHVDQANSIAQSGKLIAEYYNPNAPVSIPDYVNSYSFSVLLGAADVSEEGYTFAAIDAYGKNVTAKYIETKEFSVNPDDYPDLDHSSEVWLPEVKVVLIANGTYIAGTIAPVVDGKTAGGFEPPFIQDAPIHYLDTDSEYVVVFHTDYRWITSSPAAGLIKIDPHGCVSISGVTYSGGNLTAATNHCTLSPTVGGVAIGYTASKVQPVKTVAAADIPPAPTDGGVYGSGVDDATLESWATIKKNYATTVDGGERQCFSVNYVKDLISKFSAPARSVDINGSVAAFTEYYSSEKPLWNQYMYRDTYTYQNLFLHDVYCQGVWDAMPASYGWMQDQHTEPGKYVKQKYGLQGKSYALSLGGQNPWVLCDYLERNAGYMQGGQVIEGTNAGAGWYKGYDEVSETPYLWYPAEGVFLSYENERSLQARLNYLLEKDLGGIIIWEMSGDNTASYPLTTQIYNNLRKGKSASEQKRIIGYFVDWAVYNPYHQYQSPDDLPWDKMTHVNYSFYDVTDDFTLYTMDGWADTDVGGKEMFNEAKKMKAEYPETKLMISVGGWTRGNNFGKMVATQATRTMFINSCISFMRQYTQFDGIDLDWEYPGCAREPDFDDPADRGCTVSNNDMENYAAFCEELRAALNSNFASQGRNILSACVPSNPDNLAKGTDVQRVAAACDFLNVMTYDYHGAFDPLIGYNSPLYTPSNRTIEADGSMAWSTDFTVDYFLKQLNIPAQKLSIGTPYYSRGWAGVKGEATTINGKSYKNPAPLTDPTPIFSAQNEVLPESIAVTPKEATLKVDAQLQLEAALAPSGITSPSVTWTSSASQIASVSTSGKVTALAAGTATITAKTANGLTDTSVITVEADEPALLFSAFKVDSWKAYHSKDGAASDAVAPTLVIDSRGYVAMRDGAVSVGGSVRYEAETDSILVTINDTSVRLWFGSTYAEILHGGVVSETMTIAADQVPKLVNSRTYLPARLMADIAQIGGSKTRIYWLANSSGEYVLYSNSGSITEAQRAAAIAEASPFI